MTNQEIFDKAVSGIIAQGGPAIDEHKRCLYRAPNGNKCAAGQIISDEHYNPKMEGRGVTSDEVAQVLGLTDEQMSLVSNLQGAHDGAVSSGNLFMAEFVRRATNVAKYFKLNTNVLNEGMIGG